MFICLYFIYMNYFSFFFSCTISLYYNSSYISIIHKIKEIPLKQRVEMLYFLMISYLFFMTITYFISLPYHSLGKRDTSQVELEYNEEDDEDVNNKATEKKRLHSSNVCKINCCHMLCFCVVFGCVVLCCYCFYYVCYCVSYIYFTSYFLFHLLYDQVVSSVYFI